ncbi:unnamed protein product [Rhizoctonia solani]|uniref:ATP-dependent DNA helicase n=1 Tax=Rhizoctonia solani TaxID=456999 RepID=A0A8H2X3J5_9AGAM|nr:unnamed protein product [Rhizoctonia solani]
MLVSTEHITTVDNKPWGWFCNECLKAINSDRLPALALANRMWIGKIPPALMDLTVPEQILVSIYHPRCYVYKLHPRDLWSTDGSSAVHQNKLRGNVTTYELNMPDIVRMVEGTLIPHPTRILSSLIAVSLIGAGPVPKSWLKRTFSVRREVVHAAIHCLKYTTRHPGYQNIEISDIALTNLPVGAVPDEIMATIQYEPDLEKAQRESESYYQNDLPVESNVPQVHNGINTGISNLADNANTSIRDAAITDNETETNHNVPDAIPLQYLGTVSTDLSKVSTEELSLYGLANGSRKEGKEGGYAVRPSRIPVPDFGCTKPGADGSSTFVERNLSVYAFPFLYPYGAGGIEMERDVPVSLQDHIRANLHYWDRRFRTNSTWPFVFFGLLQKRQALNAARTQTRRKDFDRAAKAWTELKQDDFDEAAESEKRGVPITNPRILLLKRFLTAAGAKVMGSDASRAAYRSQIWSTMLVKNPPSLWVTINPNDLHDPVVQVLAGEKIDMDNFVATMGPDRQKRAENITKDPYACAQYFHYIINLVLEQLFGISSHGRKVDTRMGVLGRLSAYYGVVEAQGRGSLHVHMVLWLEDAPSSDTMHDLLSDPAFRERVTQYVDHSVRAHLDGLNAQTIAELEKDAELGYSRPPCPGSADYDRAFDIRELHLVRAQQFHKCLQSTCLIEVPYTKEKVCKRRAPFPLTPETVVSEDGQILPKRTFGYLNNWNPFILVFLGCNNDIKFISNGFDARAIIWYITAYQTKKQRRTHNASALLADGIAYHLASSDYLDDIRQRNRLLISRCLRILNRQIEQSAPQVISYLLGYGDTFCSHSYVPLYWSSVAAEISRVFPRIAKPSPKASGVAAEGNSLLAEGVAAHNQDDHELLNFSSGGVLDSSSGMDDSSNPDDEEVIVEMAPSGALTFRSQLTDYKLRGPEFEHMGFVTFVVDTWEHGFSRNTKSGTDDHNRDARKNAGKPRHPRARYLPEHPRAKTHERVMRAEGHNTLPNIVGPYLPRNDVESTYDFYCAAMLALLVPWRQITDLTPSGQSWSNAFSSFLQTASRQERNFISAAQYYYQCKEAVEHDRRHSSTVESQSGIPANPDLDQGSDDEDNLEDQHEFLIDEIIQPPRTEAELEEWLAKQQNPRERLHGTQAVDIATQAGLFQAHTNRQWPTKDATPHAATGDDLESINKWREAMKSDVTSRREAATGPVLTTTLDTHDAGAVLPANAANSSLETGGGSVTHEPIVQEEIQSMDLTLLKADQLRAYGIIRAHLDAKMANQHPRQLLMQIQGEGGTGKSTVIGCITELFKHHRLSHKLIRSAYTGIAASLIDGNTLHTLCRFTSRRTELSAKVLDALRKTWGNVDYLIIDEISMVSRPFLGRISNALGQAKQQSNGSFESLPFGGINVILTGDFHQFPPVACSPSAALYCPTSSKDTVEAAIGGQTYQAFRVVVVLQEQCRTTDDDWLDVLRHARHGTCTRTHLETIRGLILPTTPDALSIEEWEDALLVTPRHSVRLAWNQMATRRHCTKNGVRLFICPAEDTIDNRRLTITERWEAGRKTPHRKGDRGQRMKASLPDALDLAVGMEVMVTYNVETELDVANGARGVVERIIFDRREEFPPNLPSAPNGPAELSLTYPPECVLVRLYRTKAATIEGLAPGVVPIFPMTRKYEISRKQGKPAQVTRRQLPITAAYAFTDYRAQGQTIKKVIVDIARPPSGGLTPFNAYVALSRSSGTRTIRLLRDFDDALFQQPPSHALAAEDQRLVALNNATKDRWERGLPVWDNSIEAVDGDALPT